MQYRIRKRDSERMVVMDVYSSPPGQGPSRRWRRISRLRTLVGLLKLNLCRLRSIASSRVNHC
nr:MAG TPA: hypothetical protein [Bacteriophage sp.]DAG52612.1 MAG TPA: hypothetical protein [Caudoviricetes sp.]